VRDDPKISMTSIYAITIVFSHALLLIILLGYLSIQISKQIVVVVVVLDFYYLMDGARCIIHVRSRWVATKVSYFKISPALNINTFQGTGHPFLALILVVLSLRLNQC
jgi:hypothetical protein